MKLQINNEIWPMERDILYRPDRYKYVRKLIKSEGCVFCKAAKKEMEFETLCVYKTAHSMVVMNKFPYNSGHLLVIPRRHIGDLTEMTEKESLDLHQTLILAMKAIKRIYSPGGMNVGLNHGAVAGAGIPEHLHWHIVPRWSGDLNFFPLIADTKVVAQTLEDSYSLFKTYFSKKNKRKHK